MGLVASSHNSLLISKVGINLYLHRLTTEFFASVRVTDLIKADNATSTLNSLQVKRETIYGNGLKP
jgi:hypothetical protein